MAFVFRFTLDGKRLCRLISNRCGQRRAPIRTASSLKSQWLGSARLGLNDHGRLSHAGWSVDEMLRPDSRLEHKCSMPGPLGKQSAVGPHSCAYPMGIAWVPVPINLPSEPISICRTRPAKDSSPAGCPAATSTVVSLTNRQVQFEYCSQIRPDMLGTHPVIVETKPRADPSHCDLRLEAVRMGARRCPHRLLINRHSLFPSNVNRKTNAIGLGVTFDRS
ncbi:hypothetical protein PGT21_022782 [Puccinia graminis f. sp. tritici]|uniref:Uncharacterized protein n=2 Tax=Puccinia graminis f. sp. tritici TaxID=56615 RepID=E3NXA9_PUCGT|nr:uncharacterized protein PGTG_20108 [Puccinia graminis f. sp. tritici CRL 75-36-700-3]EFP94208.1 hypothetical protein PGTG_20108 [Puccinia graminis f. sp. tritici CRL 75-36-700-3]KAA1101504.1 hypothetical protein PGT21_022782 [Puccinia graminis f. sp. tritici]